MVSVNQSSTTEILLVGTFAGHIGHRPLHVHCGGKSTAPGCAHFVGAQRCQAEFPPAALVELYYEPEASTTRLRRLHLVIVDLLTHERLQPGQKNTSTNKLQD